MTDAAIAEKPEKLDDVMLAMDIVDTLRHRERLIDRELSAEAREEKLVERLREIYSAQGIDAPDHILREGVRALEEKRFVYEPPKGGLGVRLAKFYISRDRWLKPVAVITGIAAFVTAAYEFGFEAPREARAEQARIELSEVIPADLAQERDAALALAETDYARTIVETLYQDGMAAATAGEREDASQAIDDLKLVADDLAQTLSIRIVSEPGERSGVFRIHDDDPNVRNYYLIAEAVTARGDVASLEITSEEDRDSKRVTKWGVRVPEAVYNRVAADKQDDQIIQDALIGEKPKGALLPVYSVDGAGGAILEW